MVIPYIEEPSLKMEDSLSKKELVEERLTSITDGSCLTTHCFAKPSTLTSTLKFVIRFDR